MTFGSGINGCLGHGDYDDVPKVINVPRVGLLVPVL